MAAGKIFAISFAIGAVMNATFGSAMNRGSAALQQLNERTRFLNSEQRRLDRAWQQSQAQIQSYSAQMQRLRQQYEQGRISESQYQTGLARAQQGMRTAGMSADEYRNHLARLRQELDQTRASAERLRNAQAAQANASARMDSARAGLGSTIAVAGMVAAPLLGAVETAAKFEASMSKVQAITRANSEEIGRLTAEARRLGETTQFSAQQSAEAMSYLGMAGWNTEQIIAGMPGLLALAAAGGTDLARTADIVSDDLTAFGLSADKAGHMADVFAVTATRTNTNVEMIGETMKYAAPVARAFGASMEETAALTGIMANAGVKASQAGASLRAGFMRLAGPPKKASKAMDELGISLSDVSAQQQETAAALAALGIDMDSVAGEGSHKMVAILRELREKTQGLTNEQKLAHLQMIFGTEAATGWLNVLDAGPEVFEELVKQMENSDGEAEKMAQVMMNNAKGAIIQLQSALEGAAISIGTIFLPTVADMAKWGAEAAATVSSWVKEHEGLTKAAVEAGAAIAALVIAVKGFQLASAVYSYAAASMRLYYLTTMNTAAGQRLLTVATWAQARAMAAINTVSSAGTYRALGAQAAETYARLRAITWANVGNAIRAGVMAGVNGVQLAFARIIAFAQAARIAMMNAAIAIAESAKAAGLAALNMVRNFSMTGAISKASAAFRGLGTAILSVGRASMATMFSPLGIALMALAAAAYLIYANWDKVGPFFMQLWERIQTAFSNAWTAMQPTIERLKTAFYTLVDTLAPKIAAIGEAFMAAFAQVSAAFAEHSGTFDVLINIGMTVAEIFGSVLVAAFIVFANVVIGVITTAIGIVTSVINGLIGVLTGIITFITGVFAGDWSMAWNGIVEVFSSIFGMLSNIAGNILGGIKDTVTGIIKDVKDFASGEDGGSGGGGGQEIAANARGGIYRKGAFLTTFAEDSAEAAIPLDGSPRAIGLWRKAGELLGIGQEDGGEPRSSVAVERTPKKGNIQGEAKSELQTEDENARIEPTQNQRVEQRFPQVPTEPVNSSESSTYPQQRTQAASEVNKSVEQTRLALGAVRLMNAPPISITLNFSGSVQPEKVKQAVTDAAQTVQRTFAEQMAAYNREIGRLSFG